MGENGKFFLLFSAIIIPTAISATSYYEVTLPNGETSIEPFFSVSNFPWQYVGPALGGAGVGVVVILVILFFCGSTGSALKSATGNNDDVEEEEIEEYEEEEPVKKVSGDTNKNSTTEKRVRRAINRHEARIIQAATVPKTWNSELKPWRR